MLTVVLPCTLTSACMTKHAIGGAGFCTVTVTVLDVPRSPSMSVACAERVWVPADAVVVSQLTAYGEEVSALPSGFPSRKNCTEAIARLLVTVAATGTVPETAAPFSGLVIDTTGLFGGGGGPPETTFTVTGAAVATLPPESVTRALNV